MPSTMPAVENYKVCLELEKNEKELTNKIKQLKSEMRDLINERYDVVYQLEERKTGKYSKTEKKIFIKKCPSEGCKGFLSTQYKCELCKTKVCSKCFAIKSESGEETKGDDHTELIAETRNCPSCGYQNRRL